MVTIFFVLPNLSCTAVVVIGATGLLGSHVVDGLIIPFPDALEVPVAPVDITRRGSRTYRAQK